MLNGLVDAGFVVTGSWPVHTEMKTRLSAAQTAALASSIYMVCRKAERKELGFWNDIQPQIKERVEEKLQQFWKADVIRGGDFFISAIGPGMEAYSRYDRIETYSGEEITVRDLLQYIRSVATDFLVHRLLRNGSAESVDKEGQFYLTYRWTFRDTRVEYDDALRIAKAEGVDLERLADTDTFIKKTRKYIYVHGPQDRDSIDEVQQTIVLAFLLVVLIIFLFLRDWRSTLIPLIVVPIALIGSFFVMYAMGFSINVLTLLALVLAIGLVVDDAIVVLENIYSKIEEGKDTTTAGLEGTREIFFAVVATSVSLVIIFAPIIFMGGLTGQLFEEFGLVIAGAVAISSFVALTLTPMLSTRLLKKREQKPWIYRKTEPFFQALTDAYRRSLRSFMQYRWMAFVIMGGCAALIGYFHFTLPQELAPLEDQSLVRMNATAREGATYDYMSQFVDEMYEAVNETIPSDHQRSTISVTSPGFGAASSVNSAFMFTRLVPPGERDVSQMEYADSLQAALSGLTGARTFVSQEPTISVGGGVGGLPVQYVLQTSSISNLRETLPSFLQAAQAQEELAFVDVNLKFNKPELQVRIDRAKADNIGVSPLDVAQTLQLSLAEQRVGYFVRDGEQRQILAAVEDENRNEPVDLTNLYVRSSSGDPVPLGNLVSVSEQATPPQIFRFNRYMSATVSGRPAPGYTIEDGITAMDRVAEQELGPEFSTTLTGQSRDFQDTSNQLLYVFGLALVLIYLVLAAQFESFRDPLIILFTVPLALAGAMLFLWYFNQSINIFSQIGMVMLIGLVAKNGILIVEFANQRKAAGLSIREAIEEAAAVRFRPILMTALSTMLGVLPIALALGAGAESRIPMGVAVIGGLIVGTVLALYVIPATYTYFTSEEAGPVLVGGDGEAVGDGLPDEEVAPQQGEVSSG